MGDWCRKQEQIEVIGQRAIGVNHVCELFLLF